MRAGARAFHVCMPCVTNTHAQIERETERHRERDSERYRGREIERRKGKSTHTHTPHRYILRLFFTSSTIIMLPFNPTFWARRVSGLTR